jgi:hypothetical protein
MISMVPRLTLSLIALALAACGEVAQLSPGQYRYDSVVGTDAPAALTSLTLQVDTAGVVLGQRVIAFDGAPQTLTGCPTNYAATAMEARALAVEDLSVGGVTLSRPMLVASCPAAMRTVELRSGVVGGSVDEASPFVVFARLD